MRNIGFKRVGYMPVIQSVAPAPSNQLTSNSEPVTSNNEPVTSI